MTNSQPVVRVPASSANLGAGFDVLGMALDAYLDVGTGAAPGDAQAIDRHHPTAKAFAAMGGAGPVWVRSSIPMGRGLGFSGAARVGGAALAAVRDSADPAGSLLARRNEVTEAAAELEGHGDNVAASVFGGIVAWVDGRAIGLRIGSRIAAATVVAWIPNVTTSTDKSRMALPDAFGRADVVNNLGRIAQFVLAVEHDDPELLRGATDDRIHQAVRFAAVPAAAEALDAGVAAGAWCGWLSGSGPTIALLCDASTAAHVVAGLPPTGHTKLLRIAPLGVRLLQ